VERGLDFHLGKANPEQLEFGRGRGKIGARAVGLRLGLGPGDREVLTALQIQFRQVVTGLSLVQLCSQLRIIDSQQHLVLSDMTTFLKEYGPDLSRDLRPDLRRFIGSK
ncbi:MAG: hypothetical protein RL091_661, partial [Verrucomicrobiota bacterium]